MTTIRTIAAIAARSERMFLQDLAGIAALGVMLIVGLHLPVLV